MLKDGLLFIRAQCFLSFMHRVEGEMFKRVNSITGFGEEANYLLESKETFMMRNQ